MLCIGCSLAVYPVAGLPAVTLERGGRLAIVTKGPTPYDGEAALRLDGEVDAELSALLAARRASATASGPPGLPSGRHSRLATGLDHDRVRAGIVVARRVGADRFRFGRRSR